MEIKPPNFVKADLIVEGQSGFLAGPFAIGKTILTMQLVQALAAGRPFMGRTVPRLYTTAFLDLENGTDEIARRVQAQVRVNRDLGSFGVQADDFRKCLYVDTNRPGPLKDLRLDEQGFRKLQTFVPLHGIEALIIDNFGRVFSGKGK